MRRVCVAYWSAYANNCYVRMQVWHSSVCPWRTQPSGRGSNLVYMHHIRQGRTQERGLQVRPARYENRRGGGGGGGGGAVRFRPFIHPCTVYLLNGEGDLALGRGSINPHLPPLRRIRHVVTQWYVLLFLIMCAYIQTCSYNVK